MRNQRRPPTRRRTKAQTVFDPTTVPEIAAGYWWDPANASGLGGAGFKIPEGNGHTSFDLVQATTTKQPTALSENGATLYRMRKSVDANPSIVGTAGSVAAGWTGATYLGGWFRLPDASGIITGSGTLFIHSGTAGNRRLILSNVQTVGQRIACSGDGTAIPNDDFATVFAGGWVWVESLFVPSETTATHRAQLWYDFNERALGGSPSDFTTGTMPTSLSDATASIFIASRSAANANVDTTDFGAIYYGNGIPSLANRKRLRNRNRPVAAAV